jgi:hypothetical protein
LITCKSVSKWQEACAGDVHSARIAVRKLRVSNPSTTVALLAAEIDALSGDPAAAATTVEAYDDSFDTATDRAHAAHVSALVTALSQPSLERSAAAIESAVQAQIDSVRVCNCWCHWRYTSKMCTLHI